MPTVFALMEIAAMFRKPLFPILAMALLVGCSQDQPASSQAISTPVPQPTTGASQVPLTPPGQKWRVMDFRCDQMLGLADDDRAAAAMFYYGYLAASAGIGVIDASKIEGNVRRVMDRCARTPNITVADAFKQEVGRTSR